MLGPSWLSLSWAEGTAAWPESVCTAGLTKAQLFSLCTDCPVLCEAVVKHVQFQDAMLWHKTRLQSIPCTSSLPCTDGTDAGAVRQAAPTTRARWCMCGRSCLSWMPPLRSMKPMIPGKPWR